MAFIRAKTDGCYKHWYLVESNRDGKKVRQKVIRYLGSASSLARLRCNFKDNVAWAEECLRDLDKKIERQGRFVYPEDDRTDDEHKTKIRKAKAVLEVLDQYSPATPKEDASYFPYWRRRPG